MSTLTMDQLYRLNDATSAVLSELGWPTVDDAAADEKLNDAVLELAETFFPSTRTPDERWADDAIQFPRLLAEIVAVGLTQSQWNDLLVSMDLESDYLSELFDRAQCVWDRQKASVAT